MLRLSVFKANFPDPTYEMVSVIELRCSCSSLGELLFACTARLRHQLTWTRTLKASAVRAYP